MSALFINQQKKLAEIMEMTTLANVSFCGGRVDVIEISVDNGHAEELYICEDICSAWREKLVVCFIEGEWIVFATDEKNFFFLINNSTFAELEKVKKMLESGHFYLQILRKGFKLVRGN